MCVPYISNIDLDVFFQIPYTMASRLRHESAARHARVKRPIEPEPSHEREERHKARTNISLFGSLKHGYDYLVECSCVRHADTHRIRIGYVSDTPRGVSLTKQ